MRFAWLAVVAALASPAAADDAVPGSIIFARGGSLFRADTKGRNEAELVKLPDGAQVRALATDAAGKVLLVDLGSKWASVKLDEPTPALVDLPCAPGPATLAEDGLCVVCRAEHGAQIVNLAKSASTPIDVPLAGARITGIGEQRKLVWADPDGIWSAPPRDLAQKTKVAPQPPLRGFLASPDGARALGTYNDTVYTDVRHTTQADVLENFALDGNGARRKAIRDGVPLVWSHDSQWALVQDGASACIMKASGGQYKCWKSFTGASISPDGKWALVFGAPKSEKAEKKSDKKQPSSKKKKAPEPDQSAEPAEGGDAAGDDAAPTATDDTVLPPPTGPQSLYRAQLEGAYTVSPTLLVKTVDGAAVWLPAP